MVTSSFGVSCAEFDCCTKIADIQDELVQMILAICLVTVSILKPDQGFIRACKTIHRVGI